MPICWRWRYRVAYACEAVCYWSFQACRYGEAAFDMHFHEAAKEVRRACQRLMSAISSSVTQRDDISMFIFSPFTVFSRVCFHACHLAVSPGDVGTSFPDVLIFARRVMRWFTAGRSRGARERCRSDGARDAIVFFRFRDTASPSIFRLRRHRHARRCLLTSRRKCFARLPSVGHAQYASIKCECCRVQVVGRQIAFEMSGTAVKAELPRERRRRDERRCERVISELYDRARDAQAAICSR